MRKISFILAAAAALHAFGAGAAIYKWVDKDGTTHYTETPPPQDVDSRELPIAQAPEAPGAQRPAADATAPDESKGAGKGEEEVKRAAEQRKGYCALARRNVKVLESPNPVVELDTKGEPASLSDDERATALADAKRRVQTYCPQ
jgi:hypothetical protein